MTTAETIRGVLTAPAATLMIVVVIVLDGTTVARDIRTTIAEPAPVGTTETPDTPTTTPATTVEGDRSIKD